MDKFYVEHEFYAAANTAGVKVLPRMTQPVEQRPEGTLTAVSRVLWIPGEQTNHPSHHQGKAPKILLQFYNVFKKLEAKYVALHSVHPHKSYNLETEEYEERWVFRYAYIK